MRWILAVLMLGWAGAALAETPTVRVAVLKFGTVNWLMDTIQTHRLDRDNGFRLEVVPLAGKPATSIAFQSGDVDVIVSDWVWAMKQRGQGADYRFFPYSSALGALMAMEGGPSDACDLRGRPVGVVGGAVDKSWLVLQAYVAKTCGFALAEETQALFGAPPLMSRQLTTGGVDAVSTYWPFAARLEAEGASRLLGVEEAIEALGIAPQPALVGFLWDAGRSDPAAITAFRAAVRTASGMLAGDDAEWTRLRPLMRVRSEADFASLKTAYRAGIETDWSEDDTAAARRLHDLMGEIGGDSFRQGAGAFDADVFLPSDG